jgi:hypothetical protein
LKLKFAISFFAAAFIGPSTVTSQASDCDRNRPEATAKRQFINANILTIRGQALNF